MGSGGCFTQVEHPPFYVAARGLARLPLNGVPAARLRAGHARPLRQKPPFDKGGQTVEKGVLTPWPPLRGGSARRRWGRELYGCPKYFGLWQGSLPPPLRGTAPPLAQAPPPPYRGSLSRRGRFFDRLDPPLTREAFSFWHIFSSFLRFWNIFRLFCTNWLLLRFLLYYNDKV